jgi:hypothetical protein
MHKPPQPKPNALLTKPAKKRSRRKPGLWFACRRVEVEDVNNRQREVCCQCEQLPETRRLLVVDGGGRVATTRIFCRDCGILFLEAMEIEADRACAYLTRGLEGLRIKRPGDYDGIRPAANGSGDFGAEYLAKKNAARLARKAAKEKAKADEAQRQI